MKRWIILLLLWIGLLHLPATAQEPVTPLPIGQVQITAVVDLYPAPDPKAVSEKRARPGDVVLIYAQIEGWVRTANGWFELGAMALEPAVVHYSAILPTPMPISDEMGGAPTQTLQPDEIVGVAAIFEEWALLYSRSGIGWAALADLQIIEPTADLLDFAVQPAYIQVESADFYRAIEGEVQFSRPLGEAVDLLYTQGAWGFVRVKQFYGWSRLDNFDRVLMPQARGETSAGPVNVRLAPVDGRVITALDYREDLLVLGRNAAGDWLYIRARGLDGWILADFVAFAGSHDTLPVIASP